MAHADFIHQLMDFFHPDVCVPEEDEEHKAAVEEREKRAQELRVTLRMDRRMDEKIDAITAKLLSGVSEK